MGWEVYCLIFPLKFHQLSRFTYYYFLRRFGLVGVAWVWHKCGTVFGFLVFLFFFLSQKEYTIRKKIEEKIFLEVKHENGGEREFFSLEGKGEGRERLKQNIKWLLSFSSFGKKKGCNGFTSSSEEHGLEGLSLPSSSSSSISSTSNRLKAPYSTARDGWMRYRQRIERGESE